MNPRLLITLGLLGILLHSVGCAGLSGFARRTGPAYEAEVQSWQKVIHEKGGNGMWLVNRGYRLGDDIVATATGSAFPHSAILDHENGVVIEALWPGNVVTRWTNFRPVPSRGFVQPEVGRRKPAMPPWRRHGRNWAKNMISPASLACPVPIAGTAVN